MVRAATLTVFALERRQAVPARISADERRRVFVTEYLRDLNATRAAIAAGYSAKTARAAGARLLTRVDVATAVAEAMQSRAKRTEITADRVLAEIAAVAFAHMGQYATWDDGAVSLTASSEVDARAVAEVSQKAGRYGNSVAIKLHDKLAALDKLGRHLGMWKELAESGAPLAKAYPDSMMERAPKPEKPV